MHRDADGLIGLVQPAGRQSVAFGAEQQRSPMAGHGHSHTDRWGRRVRCQREQPEPGRPQPGQAVVPAGHAGVGDGEHRAHGNLHRTPVERVGASRRQEHGIHAERGGAPEDCPDVSVVDKILQHDHPPGGGGQRRSLRERLAVQRGQRPAVDTVPGELLGGLVRDDIHRGAGRG